MDVPIPTKRFAEVVTERTVERFLLRLFLREARLRAICIVAPFISSLAEARFSLRNLREKIERERIPTYVVTREPAEEYISTLDFEELVRSLDVGQALVSNTETALPHF